MKLFVDLEVGSFVGAPGQRSDPRGVRFKRGDSGEVVVQFCQGADLVDLGAGAEVLFEVKERGKYDADPLVRAESFDAPAVSGGSYSGTPAFDATAIDALLNVDADEENDLDSFDAHCEVRWRVSGEGWKSTKALNIDFDNNVIREGDELPELLLGGVPGEAATVSIAFDDGVPVSNQSGYIDVNGWRLNIHNTEGTGTPGAGALMSFDNTPTFGWIEVIRSIRDVINTGDAVEHAADVAVTGDPGIHPTVTASVIDNVGQEAEPVYLVLTAKTEGTGGNSITYDFNDSEDVEDDNGTLSGGVDPRALEIGDLVPTYEPATALTSAQRIQSRENIGVERLSGRVIDVAHVGRTWGENDVALAFFGGQSNCGGEYGTAPAGPLANVKVMKRQATVFADYSQTDNNVFSTAKANKAGALQEMARYWQARVDAGDDIPDLYCVAVSTGSAGFEADGTGGGERYWASDELDYDDDPFPENGSLWRMWMDSLRNAVEDILAQGKNPVLFSVLWAQGEEDGRQGFSSKDYERHLFEFYAATAEVLGVQELPFHMVEVLSSSTFPYVSRVNAAFERLAEVYPSARLLRWDEYSSYDQTAAQKGIYGGDGIHYDANAQANLAERQYDRLSQEKDTAAPRFGRGLFQGVTNLREIPLAHLNFVTVGSVTANATTFTNGMSYIIRSDGQITNSEGGFWNLRESFSVKGRSSYKPNTEKFPFYLQLDIIGLPENNGTLRIACGAPNTTSLMAIDGTDSGLVFEIKATGSSTFEIRAGVARAGTMTWSSVLTLSAGQYDDEYSMVIDAVNGVARFGLVRHRYGSDQHIFYHESTVDAPDGTTDANLATGGHVQIVTTVHTGTAVEYAVTATALKLR